MRRATSTHASPIVAVWISMSLVTAGTIQAYDASPDPTR
jgi:hypothetical protein